MFNLDQGQNKLCEKNAANDDFFMMIEFFSCMSVASVGARSKSWASLVRKG
ncbi:hypothetical protein IMCC3088_2213 [Aequoribacter fuscus]|uniref:Uncharacterized protein n=1 Tax=Aequoribacter fuscus TaxID=2518989 RepID=F3L3M1_9GAMM|nr:hypothetical protein IMCC3088_2213 [Aequoribacter fuscus]